MSQRRSVRARGTTSQPPPPPTTTASSTSSNSLTRNTRAANRTQSPRESSTRRSESQDDAASNSRSGPQPPRRSRRGTEIEKDTEPKGEEHDEEEGEPEEEVTRCICGQPEYPGPPAWIRERLQGDEPLSDDVGNFFVQCDSCQVWQHGGCMGLTDESMLPEQYYCEQCRPESHKIIVDRNGSKSSRYLPVLEASSSRSSSLSANESSKKNDRRQQSDASLSNAKRRATMNSRTALDDDELLRQAIEESKEMGTLGKRTRDDSEDNRQASKRQRTNSSSGPDQLKHSRSPSEGGSDNDRQGANGAKESRKVRGAAARNLREKELREKQKEKEAAATQRAEAARKREARSERRRGEDSPPPTPTFSPSKPAPQPIKDTPPPPKSNINNLRTKSGNARSHAARRGRLGRNQYTRDRDLANGEVSDTPGREGSHEGSPNGINGESGRSSKAKTHGARTSMNEMKRRVAAILEFVGRMQGEGQHGSASRSSEGSGGTPNGTGVTLPTDSLVQAVEKAMSAAPGLLVEDGKEFREMGSAEMMETLTRELIGWQNVYGRYGEK